MDVSSRTLNNRINRLHEKALRITFSNYHSTFEELLLKIDSVTIHERNIQTLGIEIYKFLNGMLPETMNNIFKFNTEIPYNLRERNELVSRKARTVKYGTETISVLAPNIWSIITEEIKNSTSLSLFKAKIRKWRPDCPCSLCKRYLQHVGFI